MANLTDATLATFGPEIEAAVKAMYPTEALRANSHIAELFEKVDPGKMPKATDKTLFVTKLQVLFAATNENEVKTALAGVSPGLGLSSFLKNDFNEKNADGNDLGNKARLLEEITTRRAIDAKAKDYSRFSPAHKLLVTSLQEYFHKKVASKSTVDQAEAAANSINNNLRLYSNTEADLNRALPGIMGMTEAEFAKVSDATKKAVKRAVIEEEVWKFIIKEDDPRFSNYVQQILQANQNAVLAALTTRAVQAKPRPLTGTEVAKQLQQQLARTYKKEEIRAALNAVIGAPGVTDDQLDAVLNKKATEVTNTLVQEGGELAQNDQLGAPIPENVLIRRLISENRDAYIHAMQGKTPAEAKKLVQAAKAALAKANDAANPDFSALSKGLGGIGLAAVAEEIHANRALAQADTRLLPALKKGILNNLFSLTRSLKDQAHDDLEAMHKRTCAAAHDPNPAAAFTGNGRGGVFEHFTELFPGVRQDALQGAMDSISANEFVPRQPYIQYAYQRDGQPSHQPFQKTAALFASFDGNLKELPGGPDPVTMKMRQIFLNLEQNLQAVGEDVKTVDDYINRAFHNMTVGAQPIPQEMKRAFWDELHELITLEGHGSDVLLDPAVGPPTDASRNALKERAKARLEAVAKLGLADAEAKIKAFDKDIKNNKDVQRVFQTLHRETLSGELSLPSVVNKNRLEGQAGPGGMTKATEYDFIAGKVKEFENDIASLERTLKVMEQRLALGHIAQKDELKRMADIRAHLVALGYQCIHLKDAMAALDQARRALAAEGEAFFSVADEVVVVEIEDKDDKLQLNDIRNQFARDFPNLGRAIPTVTAAIGVNPVSVGNDWENRKWTLAQTEGASAGKVKIPLHLVKATKEVMVKDPNNPAAPATKQTQQKVVGGFYDLHDGQVQRTFLAPGVSQTDIHSVMKKQALQLHANWTKLGTGNSINLNCDGTANGIRAMQLLRKELVALGVPDKMITFPKTIAKDSKIGIKLGQRIFGTEAGREHRAIKEQATLEFKDQAKTAAGQAPEQEALDRLMNQPSKP